MIKERYTPEKIFHEDADFPMFLIKQVFADRMLLRKNYSL